MSVVNTVLHTLPSTVGFKMVLAGEIVVVEAVRLVVVFESESFTLPQSDTSSKCMNKLTIVKLVVPADLSS